MIMRAVFFLGALAIIGLIVHGAIRLKRTDGTITIEIDKSHAARDAGTVVNKGRTMLRKAEATLDQDAERQ